MLRISSSNSNGNCAAAKRSITKLVSSSFSSWKFSLPSGSRNFSARDGSNNLFGRTNRNGTSFFSNATMSKDIPTTKRSANSTTSSILNHQLHHQSLNSYKPHYHPTGKFKKSLPPSSTISIPMRTFRLTRNRRRKRRLAEGTKSEFINIREPLHQIYQKYYKYQNFVEKGSSFYDLFQFEKRMFPADKIKNTGNGVDGGHSDVSKKDVETEFWLCAFQCPITKEIVHSEKIKPEFMAPILDIPNHYFEDNNNDNKHIFHEVTISKLRPTRGVSSNGDKIQTNDGNSTSNNDTTAASAVKDNHNDRSSIAIHVAYYKEQQWALNACLAKIFDHIPKNVRNLYYTNEPKCIDQHFEQQYSKRSISKGFQGKLASIDINETSVTGNETNATSTVAAATSPSPPPATADKSRRNIIRGGLLNKKERTIPAIDSMMKLISASVSISDIDLSIMSGITEISAKEELEKNGMNPDLIEKYGQFWRVEFKPQITNEVFKCGTLVYCGSSAESDSAPIMLFGNLFYKWKKNARNAAIGRAVDCFVHRGGWLNTRNNGEDEDHYKFPKDLLRGYINFCSEEPYDSTKECSYLIEPSKFRESNEVTKGEGEIIKVTQPKLNDLQIAPKSTLNRKYQFLKVDHDFENCFTTESKVIQVGDHKFPYFTSAFECPVTGKLFPSGPLKEIVRKNKKVSEQKPLIIVRDGKVYYTSKSISEHAAAGRAVDLLSSTNFFSSFGFHDFFPDPRFCDEEAHSTIEEYRQHDDDSTNDDNHKYVEDEEDDDEFIIEDVPQVGHSRTGATASEILLDAWADSSIPSQHIFPGSSSFTPHVIATAKAWLAHMEAEFENCSTQQSYGSKEKKKDLSITKVFSLLQAPISVFSCNAILKALGNANSSRFMSQSNSHTMSNTESQTQLNKEVSFSSIVASSIPGDSEPENDTNSTILNKDSCDVTRLLLKLTEKEIGRSYPPPDHFGGDNLTDKEVNRTEKTEDIAKSIINLMVSKPDTSQDVLLCEPNTDTLNQYMRCISRASPTDSALAAEQTLQNIIKGEKFFGCNLQCNTESYNVAIEHWMAVPIENGSHKKISQLFQELLSNKNNLQPNRKSFLMMLQSRSKANGDCVFDLAQATEWINCIEKYSSEFPEYGINVDREMFNALLPWNNDVTSVIENNKTTYHRGFQEDGSQVRDAIMNAKNIEEWIGQMERREEIGVSPDVHTFEALIQAWVRTGTEDGLLQAEHWAKIAIDASLSNDDVHLRQETFSPIISAWAHCGEKRGRESVKNWLNKLDELSQTNPNIKPNDLMRGDLITAYRRYQEVSLLANDDATEVWEELSSVAEQCSIDLFALLDYVKQGDSTINLKAAPFHASIDAWNGCLSPSCDQDEVHHSINEMLKVIDSFNDLIEWNYKRTDVFGGERNDQGLSPQLLCLHHESAGLYRKAMVYIRLKDPTVKSHLNFHQVEKMLRRFESHCKIFGDTNVAKCIEMYDEVLEWCQATNHPTRYGDGIRVAMHVMEHSIEKFQHEKMTANEVKGIYLKVVDVVTSITPRDDEKVLVLKKIWSKLHEAGIHLESEYIATLPENLAVTDIFSEDRGQELSKNTRYNKRKRIRRQSKW